MDIKKLVPWNWFKKEEEEGGVTVPVQWKSEARIPYPKGSVMGQIAQMHREMDRLFENAFRGAGFSPFTSDFHAPVVGSALFKPQMDIGATDKEYSITVEVPGVEEKDVNVEVANNTLIIRGEKKQDTEEKEKDFYKIERFYGSFQRVLSLPEDAVQEEIKASFKKGILAIKIPRKAVPKTEVKQVEIKNG